MILAIGIGLALYEQARPEKNVYLMVIGIVIFMYGMMRLSAKTPSKNQEKEEKDVE